MKTYTRRKRALHAQAASVDSKRAALRAPGHPLGSPGSAKRGADPYAFDDELDAGALLMPGPGAPAIPSSPTTRPQSALPRGDAACERLPPSSPPEPARRAGTPGAPPGRRVAGASAHAAGLAGCTRRAAWEFEAVREAAPRAQHDPEFLRGLVALHGSQGADDAEPSSSRVACNTAAVVALSRCTEASSLPSSGRRWLSCSEPPAQHTNTPNRHLAWPVPAKSCYITCCSRLLIACQSCILERCPS